MYVLDASAIIAGLSFPPNEVVVPPSIMDEVRDKPIDMALYSIAEPDEKYVKMVVEAAKKTGDYEVLSRADIQVLALALQENGTIVTDDFAIQNVASFLGIGFIGATMQIGEIRRWKWRCESCGRYFSRWYPACPVCGGKLRRVKRKGRRKEDASSDRIR